MLWALKPNGSFIKTLSSSVKVSRWASASTAISSEQSLVNIQPTTVTILDNGLTVATEDNPSCPSATVGLYIKGGPRQETAEKNGLSHFLGHMLFKGTEKRSHTDLQLEVENLGIYLNTYTNREQTAVYAKCLSKDVSKAIDIISDVAQYSKFTEADMEAEKKAIVNQIEISQNDLEALTMEHLYSVAFQGTPLARPVLGSEESVMSFKKIDLLDHYHNTFKPGMMILAGAGGVDHEALVKLAKSSFVSLPDNFTGFPLMSDDCRYTGSDVRIREDSLPSTHIAVGVKAPGWTHFDYIYMQIMKELIGSWNKTHSGGKYNASPVVKASHDEHLSESLKSFNLTCSDIGLWGIYSVNGDYLDFQDHVVEAWKTLCTSISDFEIERAKNTLKTNMLLQLNGPAAVCDDIGTQFLHTRNRTPLHETFARIDSITSDDIKETALEYIYNKCPVMAAMGTFDHTLSYEVLRQNMYWMRF